MLQLVFSLQTGKSELRSYNESRSQSESVAGLGLESGCPAFWAVKLNYLPSLSCVLVKKTGDELGSLKKKFIFEFLQTPPLKHNSGLETSCKNGINKLFCRRIIYHKKR